MGGWSLHGSSDGECSWVFWCGTDPDEFELLLLLRSAERHVDVVFILQVRVGAAGLAGFWVAFAGELEGADGFFFVLSFLIGEADLK